ncbi:MAG TPA: serine/threonine-protein kinase [Polyangia bacterium]|jgi:serine/threonine-protein kinase|nr:serine/threonine-protein kinase [Polyangia bacterium]
MDSEGQPAPTLQPGSLVNNLYRLVRLIGVGGMGEVWEARHERTKGRVALKVLLSEIGRHIPLLLRFQREAEITSGLNHPNIVRVSDFDKLPDGRPFLVMEFLEGYDLSAVARSRTPMPLAQVVEVIEQTAMGLQAAHDQGVIHRDLKPANIFLVPLPGSARFVVKILDFGISKARDGVGTLTQTHSVMGTPNYMAPEQATDGAASVDARADQFSLAAIAFELLTGSMVFIGDNVMQVLFRVVNDAPPSLASLGINTSEAVEAVMARGLEKAPGRRFSSVIELSLALKRAAAMETAAAPPQAGASESTAPTMVLPPAQLTWVLPAQSPPTTLRASSGQIAVAPTDDAERPGRARPSRNLVGAVIGGATLIAVIGVVALFRGTTVRPRPPAAVEIPVSATATSPPPPPLPPAPEIPPTPAPPSAPPEDVKASPATADKRKAKPKPPSPTSRARAVKRSAVGPLNNDL